jgi:hypothetical protein
MNLAANLPRRSTVLAACLVLLATMVTISANHAEAAAPAPVNFSLSLTADPISGNCVGQLSWEEGRGQIYVQMLLFRDVGGTNQYQSSYAGKVSTSGDPRGSKTFAHTFTSFLSSGGEGQMLDITISTAKGKGGASGDPITFVSMMTTGETATCG